MLSILVELVDSARDAIYVTCYNAELLCPDLDHSIPCYPTLKSQILDITLRELRAFYIIYSTGPASSIAEQTL